MDTESRISHPYRMWDAILETPSAVRRSIEVQDLADAAVQAGRRLREAGVGRVFAIGCGSSFYVATSAAFALTSIAGIDADAYDAFEFGSYRLGMGKPGTAVVAFSHSGATKVTVGSARLAREKGVFTVGVTDMPDGSPLSGAVDLVVPVGGGREPVEPKTRSYVSALITGYQLAVGAGGPQAGPFLNELGRIPAVLERCLALEDRAKELARKYAGVRRVLVVGGGSNYSTALEIALKFKEAALVGGEGLQIEEAFHGSIASLDANTLVIAVSAPGPSYEKVGHFVRAASMIGSPVICATSVPYDLGQRQVDYLTVSLQGLPEILSNTVLVYPLYMLAYYSALERGNNPDVFRSGDRAFHEAMASVPSLS